MTATPPTWHTWYGFSLLGPTCATRRKVAYPQILSVAHLENAGIPHPSISDRSTTFIARPFYLKENPLRLFKGQMSLGRLPALFKPRSSSSCGQAGSVDLPEINGQSYCIHYFTLSHPPVSRKVPPGQKYQIAEAFPLNYTGPTQSNCATCLFLASPHYVTVSHLRKAGMQGPLIWTRSTVTEICMVHGVLK